MSYHGINLVYYYLLIRILLGKNKIRIEWVKLELFINVNNIILKQY